MKNVIVKSTKTIDFYDHHILIEHSTAELMWSYVWMCDPQMIIRIAPPGTPSLSQTAHKEMTQTKTK